MIIAFLFCNLPALPSIIMKRKKQQISFIINKIKHSHKFGTPLAVPKVTTRF